MLCASVILGICVPMKLLTRDLSFGVGRGPFRSVPCFGLSLFIEAFFSIQINA